MSSLNLRFLWLIVFAMLATTSGCAEQRFAELYVVTPERSVDVYSASSGAFLRSTPLSKIFQQKKYFHEPLVFPVILVRDGYKTEHRVALITGWVSSKQDAVLQDNRTELRVDMHKLDSCSY